MGKQPKRKISAKAIREDIRSNMDDEALKKKHGLSEEELRRVLRKLVIAGILSQPELDARDPRRCDQEIDGDVESETSPLPAREAEARRVEEPVFDPGHDESDEMTPSAEIVITDRPPRRVSRVVIALAGVVVVLGIAGAGIYLLAPDLCYGPTPFLMSDKSVTAAPGIAGRKDTRTKRSTAPEAGPGSNVGRLLQAVEKGDVDAVKRIIERGADVNHRYKEGVTPLMIAAKSGRTDAVKLLLERGADVHATASKGWTPILYAAFGGDPETITLLLDRGAEVRKKSETGWTPLMTASSQGHKAAVALLLSKGADVHASDGKGRTPLICAASKGKTDVMRLLLDKGADINVKSKTGMTALAVAAEAGHKEAVGLLIHEGADPDVKDSVMGLSALTRAMKKRDGEIVQVLLQNGARFNPRAGEERYYLVAVAGEGRLELAKLLLEKGFEVGARDDPRDETPLSAAACKGHTDMVRLLLENGADVNAGGIGRETPLTCAFNHRHAEVIDLLISRGANVNSKSFGGDPLLVSAAFRGDAHLAGLLLGAGADVKAVDSFERTALEIACDKSALRVIEALAKHGADLNRRNPKDGGTALMAAAANGRLEVVELLLQLGADPKITDDRGFTALRYATIWKRDSVADLLKARGGE
ncbi:MAG: ankyrin repeat domain-containing protein [Pseudomonadota bacterium]